MVTPTLVGIEISDGAKLIQSLDAHGIRPTAALWGHRIDDPRWKLVIATPLVDQRGPRYAYTDVQGVLRAFRPPLHITLQDIMVVSPSEGLIKELKKQYGPIESLANPQQILVSPITGYGDRVLVYRVR